MQDLSPGCSLEAARFQQAAPAFAAANAQVVGVSMDSLEKHAEFCKQKGIGFALLSDSAGDVSAAAACSAAADIGAKSVASRSQLSLPRFFSISSCDRLRLC